MAIDAGIFQLAGRGVKSVAEYDAEASTARQNKLAEMMDGMKMDEAKRGLADQNTLRGVYAQFGSDTAANTNALYKAGLGQQAGAYAKSAADTAKDRAATEKDQLANTHAKLSLGGQILSGAKDQASYDAARATAQAHGLDVSRMPAQFDPAFVASKLQESQTLTQQLEQKWKAMEYTTPNANAVLSAQTQATGQQIQRDGQEITRRGQDLTDTRARDFNATKVEENNIKREAKDDTANLTKTSQIASFDTMLGTLDRLGKHSGLAPSVGVRGMIPAMPGSESANFLAELNTFQSQAFLPMVAQLKGMGALSDSEGKKLTAAVGALDPKMGEQAFRDSVGRITADMQAARQRMVGGGKQAAPAAKPSAPQAGMVEGGYKFIGGDPSKPASWQKVGS